MRIKTFVDNLIVGICLTVIIIVAGRVLPFVPPDRVISQKEIDQVLIPIAGVVFAGFLGCLAFCRARDERATRRIALLQTISFVVGIALPFATAALLLL